MWHSLIRVAKLYMIHAVFCVAVALVFFHFSFSFTLVLFVLSVVIRNVDVGDNINGINKVGFNTMLIARSFLS